MQCETKYKDYLTNKISNKGDMESQIKLSVQGYSKLMQKYSSAKYENKLKLDYYMNQIKSTINNLVMISNNINNINDKNPINQLCRFSEEYISLPKGSKLSDDRTFLDMSTNEKDYVHQYTMLDSKTGYFKNDGINENGKHCWRIYWELGLPYQWKWFLVGIAEYRAATSANNPWTHSGTFAVSGNINNTQYHRAGKVLHSDDVKFIYEQTINQIDMLVDVEQGKLSYKVVDDDKKREFVIDGFDTNKKWIPMFDCPRKGSKLQVAKISVSMYGKNKNLIDWPVRY